MNRMEKYLVLYMASEGDFKKAMAEMPQMTPEMQKHSMEEWVDWMKSKEVSSIWAHRSGRR